MVPTKIATSSGEEIVAVTTATATATDTPPPADANVITNLDLLADSAINEDNVVDNVEVAATAITESNSKKSSNVVSKVASSRKSSFRPISLLSPCSNTRSQSSGRKRETPTRFVPETSSNRKSVTSSVKKRLKLSDIDDEAEVIDVEDDNDAICYDTIPVIDRQKIRDLESDWILKKKIWKLDQNDIKKTDDKKASERLFSKSLFKINFRTGTSVSWRGWISGIFKEIYLTEFAKKYQDTGK